MTREDFIFNLKRCGCLYINGQTYYKENELIECFENVGAFNQSFVKSQELKWTLVSEGLPKPNQKDGLTARYYLIQNEYGDMLVARYDGKGWEQIYQDDYIEDEVIAWMSLPKRYELQERRVNNG